MFEVLGGLFLLRRSCCPKIRGGLDESTECPQAQCRARISFQHLKVAVDARTRHLASVRAPNPGAIDKALVLTGNHVRIRQQLIDRLSEASPLTTPSANVYVAEILVAVPVPAREKETVPLASVSVSNPWIPLAEAGLKITAREICAPGDSCTDPGAPES